jgi:hypothetical protein
MHDGIEEVLPLQTSCAPFENRFCSNGGGSGAFD